MTGWQQREKAKGSRIVLVGNRAKSKEQRTVRLGVRSLGSGICRDRIRFGAIENAKSFYFESFNHRC